MPLHRDSAQTPHSWRRAPPSDTVLRSPEKLSWSTNLYHNRSCLSSVFFRKGKKKEGTRIIRTTRNRMGTADEITNHINEGECHEWAARITVVTLFLSFPRSLGESTVHIYSTQIAIAAAISSKIETETSPVFLTSLLISTERNWNASAPDSFFSPFA